MTSNSGAPRRNVLPPGPASQDGQLPGLTPGQKGQQARREPVQDEPDRKPPRAKTIRTVTDLLAGDLAPGCARAGLEAVERRYAIAITPTISDLIARSDDPIGRQ